VDTRVGDEKIVTIADLKGTPTLNSYVPRILLRHLATNPEETWWTAEGTVVFVDISGFTKLSEKLAKAGKEGAEQVTDAIEACFTDLLSVAYANDGSLIKFGGDALLLWFEGSDHVADACRSAIWMRRALRDVGRIEVPGSHVQLRMSVGVHTGLYHFFHVGVSHRELVVAGPAWTSTVGMEHAAEAGEILLSPQVVEALPSRCVGDAKGPGFLLKREPPGHHIAASSHFYTVESDAIARCLSVEVRAHVRAGGGMPEHRPISIAFIHFDGTDEAIDVKGPAAVAEDLQLLLSDTQAACDEFGVCFLSTDADDDGGKLILTAGAPKITGNDEERMLLALRKIADGERDIPIRIGVNRGGVFAGDIGPWYRRTYTVMGDAVNLAARLMAKAGSGEIYATADVLEASGTRFVTSKLEPFLVKGKAKPVQAWAVGDVLGSRTRDARVQLPLIGRGSELPALQEGLAAALSGRGSLIEIVGEPGIGKSRLIEELHAEQQTRALFATAEAFTSSSPYIVWRALLRELLGVSWEADDATVISRLQGMIEEHDRSLEPWIPLLAIPLDVDMPMTAEVEQLAEEFRQPKLHEVVATFLSVTLDEATLIHVEDAHLMDGASSDLFSYLLEDLEERPWLIALTRRDTQTGFAAPEHDRVRSIRLEPLAREDVVELVEAATVDAPLLPHDVDLVADRAGGNPQFALDLAQVVASGAMLPGSIETAAMARIDALAPAERALVRRASVLGVTFHRRFLAEVLDAEALPPDDETWERLGEFFVDDGEGYLRFARAVVRDAAYAGLPFRTRRALHARVAERFEAEFNPDEAGGLLSLHFFLAGGNAKALQYARQAAARAGEQFAHRESAQLYQRAIDAGRQLPDVPSHELAESYEALGNAFYRANEYRRASAALSAAAKWAGEDGVMLARMLLQRAWIEENLGRYPQALRCVTRGLKMLEGVEGSEAAGQRSRLQQFYATVLLAEGRPAPAVRWANRAVEEARVAGDKAALARAYDSVDWSNLSLGRPSGDQWRLALEIYDELGDVGGASGILLNLGAGLFYEGRWDEALDSYQRARDGRLAVGDPVMAALAADNVAEILCERGRLDEADVLLRDSMRLWKASGNRFMLGSCLEFLSRVTSRIGRVDEALEMLAEAREAFTAVGAREDALRADARVAECMLLQRDAEGALERARAAIQRGTAAGEGGMIMPLLMRTEGYALAQLEELAGARQAFDGSLNEARSRRDDYEAALSLIALGRLGEVTDDPSARELLKDGGVILQRLGVIAVPAMSLGSHSKPVR
jgi:class 3 adenylate cyclase/tetratricopeptide (TPR) repeat protein